MLTMSCSTNGNVKNDPVVVDTACDWVKPVYVTENDVKVLNAQTKRAILSHNEKWEAICSQGGHGGPVPASAQ